MKIKNEKRKKMRNVGKLRKLLEEYDEDYKGYEYEKKLLCKKMDDVYSKKSKILCKINKLKHELKLKILSAKYKFGCLKEFDEIYYHSHSIGISVSYISYSLYDYKRIRIVTDNYIYYLNYNSNTNDIVIENGDDKNPKYHENYIEFFKFVYKNYKAFEKYVYSIENRIDSLFDNYLLAIEFLLCTRLFFPRDIRHIIANKILFFFVFRKNKN